MTKFTDILNAMIIINKYLSDEQKKTDTVDLGYDEMFLPLIPIEKLTADDRKKLDDLGVSANFEYESFVIYI